MANTYSTCDMCLLSVAACGIRVPSDRPSGNSERAPIVRRTAGGLVCKLCRKLVVHSIQTYDPCVCVIIRRRTVYSVCKYVLDSHFCVFSHFLCVGCVLRHSVGYFIGLLLPESCRPSHQSSRQSC